MRFSRIAAITFLFLLAYNVGNTQIYDPVKWSFSSKVLNDSEVELTFFATIENRWHLYSQDIPETPPATEFVFEEISGYELTGIVEESESIEEYDKLQDMVLKYFSHEATFTQKVKLTSSGPVTVKGYVYFMTCDDTKCLPPTEAEFEFNFNTDQPAGTSETITGTDVETGSDNQKPPVAAVGELQIGETGDEAQGETVDMPDNIETETPSVDVTTPFDQEKRSLWAFFFVAMLAGFVGILTPCVFPMIPMTVTFFMHDNANKRKARIQAIVYGLSIIVIYTVIGTIVAITLGPDFANFLSTHWIPNVLFFLIFIIFAASFLGAFELTMPSWLISSADKQADKGGLSGSFFMALTLVLVSFSCTGPLVGAILVESAGGIMLKPIIGMLGFALAFALPFTLFAFFPSWLSGLPKSGGWLNAVKVVLGFIELALGLKFLSIADQTYHWGILDREVYLAFWIVIFTLMGFYLIGKLKFAHDSDLPFISVTRIVLAIIVFTFVVYMVPGMFGAPLKALSGYLPPQQTHDFDINQIVRDNTKVVSIGGQSDHLSSTCGDRPKHSEFLHLPHGLEGYFDYDQGLTCAKEQNKPIFVDFTGHGCVNCREMEANVWSDPQVLKRLREDYIVIALYVDDKTKLPESEWITSEYDGKVKKTVGKKYADFQIVRFNVNAQPYYCLLDTKGELLTTPRAYDLDVDEFVDFLDRGITEFKKRNP